MPALLPLSFSMLAKPLTQFSEKETRKERASLAPAIASSAIWAGEGVWGAFVPGPPPGVELPPAEPPLCSGDVISQHSYASDTSSSSSNSS